MHSVDKILARVSLWKYCTFFLLSTCHSRTILKSMKSNLWHLYVTFWSSVSYKTWYAFSTSVNNDTYYTFLISMKNTYVFYPTDDNFSGTSASLMRRDIFMKYVSQYILYRSRDKRSRRELKIPTLLRHVWQTAVRFLMTLCWIHWVSNTNNQSIASQKTC